jgi:hypothetical protein
MGTRAFLRRERLYVDGSDEHRVQICADLVADDGLRIDMGEVTGAWWDLPLPACPDCEGELVWADDNGHRWEATEEEDNAAGHKCPTCGDYWQ